MTGGQQTLADYAVDIVSDIGAGIASARARALGSESTIAGLDSMAEGISAVSIDDEMIGLIKLQQAFSATAKLLQTADEMFSTLLSL
jgi:flagellar hook-associated protein 1